MIAGVRLTPLRCIDGPDGAVLHALKRSAEGFVGFAEAYFSEIREGAIKSWRRHSRVTANLAVPAGAVRFVLHANGEDGAETFAEYRLGRTPADYARLTVPPGIWFAFQGIGPGTSFVLSIIDAEHDPAEAETKDLSAFAYPW